LGAAFFGGGFDLPFLLAGLLSFFPFSFVAPFLGSLLDRLAGAGFFPPAAAATFSGVLLAGLFLPVTFSGFFFSAYGLAFTSAFSFLGAAFDFFVFVEAAAF
jgi:hypothetical protein